MWQGHQQPWGGRARQRRPRKPRNQPPAGYCTDYPWGFDEDFYRCFFQPPAGYCTDYPWGFDEDFYSNSFSPNRPEFEPYYTAGYRGRDLDYRARGDYRNNNSRGCKRRHGGRQRGKREQSASKSASAASETSSEENLEAEQQSDNATPLTLHQVKGILTRLCNAYDGKMTVASLRVTMSHDKSFALLSNQQLGDLLGECSLFVLWAHTGDDGPLIVKAVTALEICDSFSREKTCLLGDMCPRLHICKRHALAQECAKRRCSFGHNFKSKHNWVLVKNHCLDVLSNDQMRRMLLQNYIRQNFRPCTQHSTKEDCKLRDQCPKLHICKYFIQNRCTAKGHCPRSHDLMGSQPRHLLASHGIFAQKHQDLIIQELKDGFSVRDETGAAEDQSVKTKTSGASTKQRKLKINKAEPVWKSRQFVEDRPARKRSRSQTRKSNNKGALPTPKSALGMQEAKNVILFEVCEAGGSMSMDDLIAATTKRNPDFAISVESSAANIEKILMKWPKLFKVEQQTAGTAVTAFTSLTICMKSGLKAGCQEECGKLHLCRNYLTNTCSFGKVNKQTGKTENPCRYGHRIRTPHNLKALKRHHLDEALAKHVKLLVRNSSHLKGKPMICRFYNSVKGCRFSNHAGAKTKVMCKAMHVCYYHIKGNCTKGAGQCPRTHSVLEPQPRAVLLRHGINVRRPVDQIIQELREMMTRDEKPESVIGDQDQDDVSDEEDEEDNLISFSDDELIYISTEVDSSSDESDVDEAVISFDGPVSNPQSVPSIAVLSEKFPLIPLDVQFPADDIPSSLTCQLITKPDANSNLLNDEVAPEICLYHLGGQCGYNDSCKNEHCPTPYQWQEMIGRRWSNFSARDNEDIEVNYCDPCKTECFIGDPVSCPKKVDFLRMSLTESGKYPSTRPVRRLSTPSTVEKPAHYTGTTTWQWYWERSPAQWLEYGVEHGVEHGGTKTEISSTDIEEKFLQDPFGGLLFTVDQKRYLLDLKKMVQNNLDTNGQRSVRRRPYFLIPEKKADPMSGLKEQLKVLQDKMLKLEMKGKEAETGATGASTDATMPYSRAMNAPGQHGGLQLITSEMCSQEYKMVTKLFKKTLPNNVIQCVRRVQNPELWDAFQSKKASMQRKLPQGATVHERYLFHGTSLKYVDAICQQGFDWRVCGLSVGTKYGKGSYFARDAKLSSCYTDPSNSRLFLARVLVGKYTLGKKDMVRPPPKDPSRPLVDLYDSCVDTLDDPSIFVIFNQNQAYPEWLIEY